MMAFVAVVAWDTTSFRLAKFQDFETQAAADAHVQAFGGFVVPEPAFSQSHWLINPGTKTISDSPPPPPPPLPLDAEELYDMLVLKGTVGSGDRPRPKPPPRP